MADTWYSDDIPATSKPGAMGWVRVIARGGALVALIWGGLLCLLAIRLFERPICGQNRPITPYITQCVCRLTFVVLGVRFISQGVPLQGRGAVVSNHVSWLDIFALNAGKRIYFVSKSEVAGWPGIGWLARATGTVFIKRTRQDAANQTQIFRDRLRAGHKLLFFPEGTSTDGQQVLTFKPTLFAAFFDDSLADQLHIQPVTVNYTAPTGEDTRFYGWWGNMDLGPHLLGVLAAKRQGTARVTYHPAINVADFKDRKALAKAAENAVRSGLNHLGA